MFSHTHTHEVLFLLCYSIHFFFCVLFVHLTFCTLAIENRIQLFNTGFSALSHCSVLPIPFVIILFFSWCFVGSFVCYYIYFNSINIYNNDDGMWQKFFLIIFSFHFLLFSAFLVSWKCFFFFLYFIFLAKRNSRLCSHYEWKITWIKSCLKSSCWRSPGTKM